MCSESVISMSRAGQTLAQPPQPMHFSTSTSILPRNQSPGGFGSGPSGKGAVTLPALKQISASLILLLNISLQPPSKPL